MTNMYNMPFAPFIGINWHGQSFMLGCAFVRQELTSSFDWIFRAFLEAMGGKPPDNFITDQDGAMKQPIESIFPTTVHCCCRCHIMKKAQEKVGWLLCQNPGLSDDFNCWLQLHSRQVWAELSWVNDEVWGYDTHTHAHTLRSCTNTGQLGCRATSNTGSSPFYDLHSVVRGSTPS